MKQRVSAAARQRAVKQLVCLAVALAASACGRKLVTTTPAERPQVQTQATASAASLEAFMQKVRALSAESRASSSALRTLEMSDPGLKAALAASIAAPSPQAYRSVAEHYVRLGVIDRAFAYLSKAVALDDRDWVTYDALARLWRDQGFPHAGLGDAYRAVYYAQSSPIARNTLGTMLQALGRREEAARQYELASRIDPKAAYALSNLCYTRMLSGKHERAIAACQQALAIEPDLAAARNNLGLAYAAAGDVAASTAVFAAAKDRASALYNVGIVSLAQRRFTDAVTAFAEAQKARPSLRAAAARQRQAERELREDAE